MEKLKKLTFWTSTIRNPFLIPSKWTSFMDVSIQIVLNWFWRSILFSERQWWWWFAVKFASLEEVTRVIKWVKIEYTWGVLYRRIQGRQCCRKSESCDWPPSKRWSNFGFFYFSRKFSCRKLWEIENQVKKLT